MTIRTWAAALGCVLAGWVAVQALVMRFSDAAPGAIVIAPGAGFTANLPADIAIVGTGKRWIAVRSDRVGMGKTLYGAGALLVLPAGLPGCLPLPESPGGT